MNIQTTHPFAYLLFQLLMHMKSNQLLFLFFFLYFTLMNKLVISFSVTVGYSLQCLLNFSSFPLLSFSIYEFSSLCSYIFPFLRYVQCCVLALFFKNLKVKYWDFFSLEKALNWWGKLSVFCVVLHSALNCAGLSLSFYMGILPWLVTHSLCKNYFFLLFYPLRFLCITLWLVGCGCCCCLLVCLFVSWTTLL